jgi:hypothetical protein
MKFFILIASLILIHKTAIADCINQDAAKFLETSEQLENLIEVEFANHKLIFSKDSCGAYGCEIRIFTKITPFCTRETLTTKGFYIDGSLTSRSVEITRRGVNKRFEYFSSEMRFK